MPWALQHFGDKNVSICRRRSRAAATQVSALPSSNVQSIRTQGVISDEKSISMPPPLDGESGKLGHQPVPIPPKRKSNPRVKTRSKTRASR
jgi:hypothetical protein